MKKTILIALVCIAYLYHNSYAQNVFNPQDSILRWNAAEPLGSISNPNPNLPGLQKWVTVETNGISTGSGSFDASSFKSYYIKVGDRAFAFRLRFPRSFTDPDSSGKKYPLRLFFHGAGEPGCPANGGVYNNEKHLLFGAQFFMDKVNAGAYDGFLLYPQNNTTNTGCYASSWGTIYFSPIVSLLDSLEKYVRLDKERVLADGLSAGGIAAWKIAELYPRSIAGIAPSSAVGGTGIDYTKFVHIPVWMATGEVDNNPALSTAQLAVSRMRNLGGYIRHTIYAGQGHFVWGNHWSEPDYTVFMNEVNKVNPLVFFQHDGFCPGAPVNAKLGVTPGYLAYEWQKDGVTIASSLRGVTTIFDSSSIISFTGNEITVKSLGIYRVRFRRIATSEWTYWSPKPAVIQLKTVTQTPEIQVAGLNSKYLPSPDGHTTTPLFLPEGFTNYQWYRLPDSVLVNATAAFNAPAGEYIARYAEAFGCGSLFSPTFTVMKANDSTAPATPTDIKAYTTSFTSVKVSWTKDSSSPYPATGYEVYRAAASGGPYTLIAQVPADTTQYLDDSLVSNTVYHYTVRAINLTSASAAGHEAVARAMADNIVPAAPRHLRFWGATPHSVLLRWNEAADNVGVKLYEIFVNGEKLHSSRDTTFTVGGLDSAATYLFTVRAVDHAGNVSAFSNEATGFTHDQGLHYKYYHGTWNMLPDFNSLTPEKTGITHYPGSGTGIRTQNDYFGFLWEGYIYIADDGNYTFETASDDGSKLYIGNYADTATPVVNNDGAHALSLRSGTIKLTRGYHPVAVTFFEAQGQEELQLYWSSNLHNREQIPASVFSLIPADVPPPAEEADSIRPRAPAHLQYKGSTLQSIRLQWRASTDNIGIKQYIVYANDIQIATTADTSIIVTELDSLTLYHFTVRASDRIGNLSAPSNEVNGYTHHQGLNYKYYHGSWEALPPFDTLAPELEGITDTISINAGIRTRDDQFALLWQGYLFVPQEGIYTFETVSDDGSKLYIDSMYTDSAVALVDNDRLHATQAKSAAVFLTRGYHRIAASFFEQAGGEVMEVNWWNDKGLTRQGIPRLFFSTDSITMPPVAPDTTEPVDPSDSIIVTPVINKVPDGLQAALQTDNNNITLSWNDNSPEENGYLVWRKSQADTGFHLIMTTGANVNAWTDTNTTAPNRYLYYVAAIHDADSSLSTDTAAVFTGNTEPTITLSTTLLYLKTDAASALNFSVTDAATDSIAVSISGGGSFINLVRTAARNYRFNFLPLYGHIGTYVVKITARDDKGASSEKLLTLFVSDKNVRTVYINFGHASLPAPRPWNNWVGVLPDSSTKTGLRDERYNVTTFYIKMLQGMSTVTGLGFNTGYNTGVFPDTVLERGVRDPAATRQMLIGGLNPALRYNLVFVGSVNEGTYAANSYTSGSQKDTLEIRYNAHGTGNLNNLTPNSNGEIPVTINRLPGTPYIYLNGMAIEEFSPDIAIMSPNNLYAEPVSQRAIAVSWSDRTLGENATDGFELDRALDSLFTQQVVHIILKGNSIRYTDTGLTGGTKYWYRVRAKVNTGYSIYSNVYAACTPVTGIYVNFNHNGPAANAPWNNLGSTAVLAQSYPPLSDERGRNSGIVLTLTRPFNGENVAGVNTRNNSGIAPDNVLRSNFWTDKKQVSQFRVSGLQHKKRYSFGFIGSMGPEGWYIGNYTATYTINGKTVYLNSWNNTTKIVWIPDVTADEYGEVVIDVSTTRDAGYGFNAGMVIFEYQPAAASATGVDTTSAPRNLITQKAVAEQPALEQAIDQFRVYPNPFNGQLNIAFQNNTDNSPVSVKLFSLNGTLVWEKQLGRLTKGNKVFSLTGIHLRLAGVYMLALQVDGKTTGIKKVLFSN